jgi:hypothetical protein
LKKQKSMDIKLVGALPRQLRELGLKTGDRFQDVPPAPGHREGAVWVRFMNDDAECTAIVYRENYLPLHNKRKR